MRASIRDPQTSQLLNKDVDYARFNEIKHLAPMIS
jgi:hypothetical protein